MTAQIPGIGYVDETGAAQAQLPGAGFVSESVLAALTASSSFTTDDVLLEATAELGFLPRHGVLAQVLQDAVLEAFAKPLVTGALSVQLAAAARVFASPTISRPVRRVGRLLYEDLPLRTTRMLGVFADDGVLGQVYGDLTDAPWPLLRLTDRKFFAADHPVEMTGVVVDQIEVDEFAQALETDGEQTWTVVNLTAPAPLGAKVWGKGRGKRDPLTGELIRNPADIVTDVMRIAGRDEDWSALRADTSTLRIAGRIAEVKSIRAWVDDILQSVAVIWAPGMARRYPTSTDASPILDLAPRECGGFAVSAALDDTADVLRIGFDGSDASGRMQQQLELSASPQRFNGIAKDVSYAWLRSVADAEMVGRPVLERLAGERYDVTFVSSQSLRPGTRVRPVAHPEWPLPGDDPIIMVLGVDVDPSSNEVRVRGETLLSTPTVTVTARSLALPDTTDNGLSVAFANGIATFTATDENGNPLIAFIALDGSAPKATDAAGRASFIATEGPHRVDILANGYVPVSMVITL